MLERASPPVVAVLVTVLVAAVAHHTPAPDCDRFLQVYVTNRDLGHPIYGYVDRSRVKTATVGGEVCRTFMLESDRHSIRVFAHGGAGLWKWESWANGKLVPAVRAGGDAAAFGITLDDDEPVLVVGALQKKTWTKYEGLKCLDELFGDRCRD